MGITTYAGRRRNRVLKAFTLVELLTVIAIIAILAAMLMPALGRARTRARTAAAQGDINSISLAMEEFANDFNRYPPDEVLSKDDFASLFGGQAGYNDAPEPDPNNAPRYVQSGWALVFYLSEELVTPAGATVGPYLDFDSARIRLARKDDGDTYHDDGYVYVNPFATGFYMFRNNDSATNHPSEGDNIADSSSSWEAVDGDWQVSYVNRNSVDIWTPDDDGEHFWDIDPAVDVPHWRGLRDMDDIQGTYKTISNW